MHADLIGRGDREEEMGVEALGHPHRRDPVCERHQQVQREHEVLGGDEIRE